LVIVYNHSEITRYHPEVNWDAVSFAKNHRLCFANLDQRPKAALSEPNTESGQCCRWSSNSVKNTKELLLTHQATHDGSEARSVSGASTK